MASKTYWVQPRMSLQYREKCLRWPPHPLDCMRRGRPIWELRDTDRGLRMEQGAMPEPARLNNPLDTPLNHVLNGRLSSCEEGCLWGFPTSWPRET
jgi:hypothetical protein